MGFNLLTLLLSLLPLVLLGFVSYVLWKMLQTLRSIDRNMTELGKNLRS